MRSKMEQEWRSMESQLFHVRLVEVLSTEDRRFCISLEFMETGQIIDAIVDPVVEFIDHKGDDESTCFECGEQNPPHKIDDGVALCDDCYNNEYGDFEK